MEQKLPYYMAYPMSFLKNEEKKDRMDDAYMKSLYPATAKKMLPYVEEECDRMEYEGSMMYDEYPDRLQLLLMGNRIYDKMKRDAAFEHIDQEIQGDIDLFSWKRVYAPDEVEEDFEVEEHDIEEWRKEMIQILLYQELYKRRCERRKNHGRFYQGIDFSKSGRV